VHGTKKLSIIEGTDIGTLSMNKTANVSDAYYAALGHY